MRIDSYVQVQQLYNKPATGKSVKETGKGKFRDQLQISSMGKDIQVAKQAVKNAPDIRQDLVDSVKSRIEDGTYEMDNTTLAERLYQKYASY